jgi:hypothetical protein
VPSFVESWKQQNFDNWWWLMVSPMSFCFCIFVFFCRLWTCWNLYEWWCLIWCGYPYGWILCGVERLVRSSLLDVNEVWMKVEAKKVVKFLLWGVKFSIVVFGWFCWFYRFLFWKNSWKHLKENCLKVWATSILEDDRSSAALCILERKSYNFFLQ